MKILRTGLLLILLSVLLVVAGGAIGGQSGLKIALGIAVVDGAMVDRPVVLRAFRIFSRIKSR